MCKFFLCDIEGLLLGLPMCEDLGIVTISIVDEVSEKPAVNGLRTNGGVVEPAKI